MGKSNKKNVSKQQKMIVKDITPELIASQSSEVENIENTLLEASDDTILEEAELSSAEKKQVDEIMASNDAEKYLERLLSIHKMLLAAKKKYEDLQLNAKNAAESAEKEISQRKAYSPIRRRMVSIVVVLPLRVVGPYMMNRHSRDVSPVKEYPTAFWR